MQQKLLLNWRQLSYSACPRQEGKSWWPALYVLCIQKNLSMYTPEAQAQILLWRQKALEGTLSLEEMKQAIALLRSGRGAASAASAKAKAAKTAAKPKTAVDSDKLLDELGDL